MPERDTFAGARHRGPDIGPHAGQSKSAAELAAWIGPWVVGFIIIWVVICTHRVAKKTVFVAFFLFAVVLAALIIRVGSALLALGRAM